MIVTHAERVRLTGRKGEEKVYRRHSGYPGGLKSVAAPEMRAKYPERLIEEAVRGMLPKTKLGRRVFKKLKVYRGASHPHQAQQPKPLGRVAAGEGQGVGGESVAVEIQHRSVGRRKTSVARVRLVPGSGAITVNRRPLDEYFPNNVLKMIIKQPLLSTETAERFDIHVAVDRGRALGPGRRDPARHLARPDRVQRRVAQEAEEGGLPLARSSDEGTQEVRSARRARPLPVQQAVVFGTTRKGGVIWRLFR